MKAILKRGTRYLNSYEEAKSRIQGMKAFREDDWDFAARQGTLDAYSTAIANSDNVDLDKMNNEYGLDYGNQETRIQALYNEVGADRTKLVKRTRNLYDEQGNITGTEDYEMTDYDYTKSLIKQYTDYHKALQDAEWEKSLKENRSFFGKLGATVLNAGWHFSKGMMDAYDNMYKFMMGIGEGAKYIANHLVATDPNYTIADAMAEGFQKPAFFESLDKDLGTTDYAMEFERNYVLSMDTQGTGNWWRNFWDGTEESAGNMFAAWTVGSVAGAVAGSAGMASSEVATVSKIASTTSFYGAMTAGNVREVYDGMADNCGITSAQILANAALKSVFQLGVEHALGRLFGGASSLDNLVFGRTARNVAGTTFAKAGTKRLLTDMLQEGLEEVFQDWSDYWVNKWFTQYQNENFGQFTTRPTLQTMFDAFLGGAVMSLGGSAIQILNQKKEYLGALDKSGNIKLDENGKPIYKKLGKLESWEYTFQLNTYMQQMNSVIEEVEKYTKEGTDVSEQLSEIYKTALSEVYASYRLLHDMYNSMGDERFGQAMNCLKTISEMEKLDREKAYETYEDYKKALTSELEDLGLSATVASIVGKIDAKELKEKRLKKVQKVFNRKEVSSIPDNVDYKNTLREVFDGMPTLEDVVITREGTNLIIAGSTLVIPENLLKASNPKIIFSADAENRMYSALIDTLEQWSMAGNTKGILNQILDVYKKFSGDNDANYAQAVMSLLYDPEFFKTALYRTDIDAVKMLTAFDKLYNSIVSDDVRNDIYKTKVGKTIRDMRRTIIEFMCEQPLCDIGYIKLTDAERETVMSKRWGKDRILKALSGIKINKTDMNYFVSQIDSMNVTAEHKRELKDALASDNRDFRIQAVKEIREYYKYVFYGKYDGEHYLQPTSIANCAFNQYLMKLGLTMDQLFDEEHLTDADRELLNYKTDKASIINYRKQQFNSVNGMYTIGVVNNKVVTIYNAQTGVGEGHNLLCEYWQSGKRDKDITLSDGTVIKVGDEVTITGTHSRDNLLDDVLSQAINKGVRSTIEINDVVSDPSLLNADISDMIMSKYGEITPETTYDFLHNYFAEKTKTTTLVVDKTGKVLFADYTLTVNTLKDDFELNGDTKITDVVKDEYLKGSVKGIKLEVINNPKSEQRAEYVDVDYDEKGNVRATNVLRINKANFKGQDSKIALAHELRHAFAYANGLSSGFSAKALNTVDKNKYHTLAEDFRRHMPNTFEGIPVGSDAERVTLSRVIYSMSGGEIIAEGISNTPVASLITVSVEYSHEGTIITTPWGTVHNLGDVANDELNQVIIADAVVNDNGGEHRVEAVVEDKEPLQNDYNNYKNATSNYLKEVGWSKRLRNKDSRLRQTARDKMTSQLRDNMLHLLHIDLGLPCEYTDFENLEIPVVRLVPRNTNYNNNNFGSAFTGNSFSEAVVNATPAGLTTNNLNDNYIVKSGTILVKDVKAYINGELFISDEGSNKLKENNISTEEHKSQYISDIAEFNINSYRDYSPGYVNQKQAIEDRQRLNQVTDEITKLNNSINDSVRENGVADKDLLSRKARLFNEYFTLKQSITGKYIQLSYLSIYENLNKFTLFDLVNMFKQLSTVNIDDAFLKSEIDNIASESNNFDLNQARYAMKSIIEYMTFNDNPGREYGIKGPNPFYWNDIDENENIIETENDFNVLRDLEGNPVSFKTFDGFVGYSENDTIVPLSTWFNNKPIMSDVTDLNGNVHSVYYESANGNNTFVDAYTNEEFVVDNETYNSIEAEARKRVYEYKNKKRLNTYNLSNYSFSTVEDIRRFIAMNSSKEDSKYVNRLISIMKSIGATFIIDSSNADQRSGNYARNNVMIRLYGENENKRIKFSPTSLCRTMVHEMMHGVTTFFLQQKIDGITKEALDAYVEFYNLSIKYLAKEDLSYLHQNTNELLSEITANEISSKLSRKEFSDSFDKLNEIIEKILSSTPDNLEQIRDFNINVTNETTRSGFTDKTVVDERYNNPSSVREEIDAWYNALPEPKTRSYNKSEFTADKKDIGKYLRKDGKPRKGVYEYKGSKKNVSLYVDPTETDVKKLGLIETPEEPNHKYVARYILIDDNGEQVMKKTANGSIVPVYSYEYVPETRTISEDEQSSLKYFKSDVTRREVPSEIRKFVVYSDEHKIAKPLQDKIDGKQKGTLKTRDVMDFLRNEETIDEETFEGIRQVYFPDSPVRSLKELDDLVLHATEFYAIRAAVNSSDESYLQEQVMVNAKDSIAFFRDWLKIKKDRKYNNIYNQVVANFNDNVSDKYLRILFMKYYDGTLYSAGRAAGIALRAARLNYLVTGEGSSKISDSMDKSSDDNKRSPEETINEEGKSARNKYVDTSSNVGEDEDYLDKIDAIKRKMQIEIAQLAKVNEVDVNTTLKGLYYINRILSGEEIRKNGKIISETEINQMIDDYINNNMSLEEIDKLYELSIFSDILGIEPEDKNFAKLDEAIDKLNEETPERKVYNIAQNIHRTAKEIAALCSRYKVTPAMRKKLVEDSNGILNDDLTVNDDAIKNVKIGEDYTGRLTYRTRSELLAVENKLKVLKKDVKNTAYANTEFHKMLKRERNRQERNNARLEKILADKNKTGGTYDDGSYKTKTYRLGKSDVKIQVDEQESMPDRLREMFENHITKIKQTEVQLFSKEGDTYKTSGINQFIKDNTETLLSLSQEEIEEIVRYLVNTHYSLDTEGGREFNTVKTCVLAYILKGNAFLSYQLDEDLRSEMELQLRTAISGYGQGLANARVLLNALRPEEQHISKYSEDFDIPFTDEEKTKMYYAIISHDAEQLAKAKNELYSAALARSKGRKESIWLKIQRFESAMMLSAPTTWVRNKTTNIKVEQLNKVTAVLGNFLTRTFRKKDANVGFQYKLVGTVTQQKYKDWIQVNLIDSGLSKDVLVGLSKYDIYRPTVKNPTIEHSIVSAITDGIVSQVLRDTSWRTKSELVNKIGNKFYGLIFDAISDNKHIERVALGYLGKMMTERNVTLDKGMKSPEIIKLIGDAYVLAAADFMHKTNFMSNLETKIFKYGTAGWFIYKQAFPFAAASWNWFIESSRYSPVGLAVAIRNYCKLENVVAKMDESTNRARKVDKTAVDKSFATFLVQRDIGKGVLGSIGWLIGLLLVGIGGVKLDDTDDKYKIDINGVKFDISDTFGLTGMYLGMTFMQSIVDGVKGDEDTYKVVMNIFNSTATAAFKDSVFADMYDAMANTNCFGDFLLGMSNDALSKFWPNFLKVLSAEMNSRYRQYDNGFSGRVQKLLAKWLPGYAWSLPSQVNPYTGEFAIKYNVTPLNDDFETILIQAFNKHSQVKISPYKMSSMEKEAINLGVKTHMLTCKYTANGESIDFTNEEVVDVNLFYGNLNKKALSDLRTNKIAYTVKNAKGDDVKLRYNDMTDEQKKSAIESIINKNQNLAKIYGLTNKGYRYYATPETFKSCKEAGIKNVYYKVGNKSGYVK